VLVLFAVDLTTVLVLLAVDLTTFVVFLAVDVIILEAFLVLFFNPAKTPLCLPPDGCADCSEECCEN
jgi:hypothetical protein